MFNKVTDTLMAGGFKWMYQDIYTDVPPEWRTEPVPNEPGSPIVMTDTKAREEEPVAAPK